MIGQWCEFDLVRAQDVRGRREGVMKNEAEEVCWDQILLRCPVRELGVL